MFTQTFITEIATAAAITVGITQMLKRWLKLNHLGAIIMSIAISFVVAIPKLPQGVIYYLTLAVFTALTANGLFKAVHTPRKEQ